MELEEFFAKVQNEDLNLKKTKFINEKHNEITALGIATQKRNEKLIEKLLECGADIDAPADWEDSSVLGMCAQDLDAVDILVFLLGKGANVDAPNVNGTTPLHHAAYNRNKEAIEILLRNGADINKCDKFDRSAFLYAATKDVETMKLLESKGAQTDIRDCNGNNAFHNAAAYGNVAGIEFLLSLGLDPSEIDKNGESALHDACFNDHVDAAIALVKGGADPDEVKDGQLVIDAFPSPQSRSLFLLGIEADKPRKRALKQDAEPAKKHKSPAKAQK